LVTLLIDPMAARRLRGRLRSPGARLVPAAGLAALTLGACGQSQAQRTPDVNKLPLVPGAKVALRVQECDTGANAFCAWELLVVAEHYRSSDELVKAEHALLLKSGWSGADADTGDQHAADSPGHKLRITYATPSGDLRDIVLGSVKRSRKLTLALSHVMFVRSAAMSMLLEVGAS
jgi:hypothetical protein